LRIGGRIPLDCLNPAAVAVDALAVRVVLPPDGRRCGSVEWTRVSDDVERS
jgi:hypothetical protein